MVWHMFMVFVMSTGFFFAFMRALQFMAHAGWFTRRARSFWVAMLTFGAGIIAIGYLSAVQLPPERWVASAALGVIVATLLLVTSKRPQRSNPS